MRLGLFLLACYIAYGIAAYGAPELKVIGMIVVILYICAAVSIATNKVKDKAKVLKQSDDKL